MMSTKSKHKPVTLAKTAADFSTVEADVAHDMNKVDEVAVDHVEVKAAAKPSKISKNKVSHDKSHDAGRTGHDVIGVYRNLAERSLDQARLAFAKARDEAQVLSGKIEESSSAITQGTSAVQNYVVQAMQIQSNDLFGYFRALAEVKTMSDAIALQSQQSRKSLDASLRQFKDLSALVNEMVVKASTPIRSAFPAGKD